MSKDPIKVAVERGGGPPPGYEWWVGVLDLAHREAESFLDKEQYRHLSGQVKELATQGDPSHSATISVRKIEDIYEIRDSGGILKDLNVRIFFGIDDNERALIVLGAVKKQNRGKTPLGDKLRMRRRWRRYQNNDYGTFPGR